MKNTAMNVTSFDLSKALILSRFFTKVELKITTKLVLTTLITFWNPKHGKVFPRQKTVAEYAGISLKSVNNAINELRAKGIVLTNGEQGEKLNYYFTPKFFELLGFTQDQEKNTQGGYVKSTYHGTSKTEQINNNVSLISSFKSGTPKYLTSKEYAEFYLNNHPLGSLKQRDKEVIREIKEKWNFSESDFAVFKYLKS